MLTWLYSRTSYECLFLLLEKTLFLRLLNFTILKFKRHKYLSIAERLLMSCLLLLEFRTM